MRLTDEVKKYWKIFRGECDVMLRRGGFSKVVAEEQIPMVDAVLKAFDTIEALQAENEQLRAQVEQVRGALRKASARDRASWFECDRCANMRDALAEIDKVIGGE